MYIEQLYTGCLAEAAYYIESDGEVAIIDPLRETEPYIELAKQYGYQVFTIIVENRHGGVNQHGVPAEKIEQMRNRFEVKL